MKTQYATVIAIFILFKGLFALPIAPASAVELKEGAQNVGILLFNDLFITEFVAPFDIYKHVGKKL